MKDKEYHVANFATFVSKNSYSPPPPKMDEFNFKTSQYCINKIFDLTKSCIWSISKWMRWSDDWTSCRAILGWNHTCDFWNHAYDFSPNCTPLSSVTIINLFIMKFRLNARCHWCKERALSEYKTWGWAVIAMHLPNCNMSDLFWDFSLAFFR